MVDILQNYMPQFQEQVAENRTRRNQLLDTITQTLSDKTPKPMEVAHMASESLRPLTTFDIARGTTRPSALEALTAARAASAKYDIDLLGVAEKGMSGVAEEAQQLANLINAQAQIGNRNAGKVKDVLSSVTDGMHPDSQVMFTSEFLSRLQAFDGEPDANTLYSIANDVVKTINPKAKPVAPKFPFHLDDNGNRVTYGELPDGSFGVINVTPPKDPVAPTNRIMPIITKSTDPNSGITTETTTYEGVAPGREGQTPKRLGPVGGDGPYNYGESEGYYLNPVTGQPDKNRPIDPTGKLQSTKETPPTPMDLKDSSNLASVVDAKAVAMNVKNKLFKDGKIDDVKVAEMWSNFPRTEGRQLRQELSQAVFNYIFIKSGQTVTDNEREIWLKLFMPSPLDSDAANMSKLERLEQFFDGATDFLPKHLQKRLENTSGNKPNTPTQPGALDAKKQAILDTAKKWIGKVDTDEIKRVLKENGIDPGLLK